MADIILCRGATMSCARPEITVASYGRAKASVVTIACDCCLDALHAGSLLAAASCVRPDSLLLAWVNKANPYHGTATLILSKEQVFTEKCKTAAMAHIICSANHDITHTPLCTAECSARTANSTLRGEVECSRVQLPLL